MAMMKPWVDTEGGPVKSPAKAIKDIEAFIQAGLSDLGSTSEQLAAVAATEGS